MKYKSINEIALLIKKKKKKKKLLDFENEEMPTSGLINKKRPSGSIRSTSSIITEGLAKSLGNNLKQNQVGFEFNKTTTVKMIQNKKGDIEIVNMSFGRFKDTMYYKSVKYALGQKLNKNGTPYTFGSLTGTDSVVDVIVEKNRNNIRVISITKDN